MKAGFKIAERRKQQLWTSDDDDHHGIAAMTNGAARLNCAIIGAGVTGSATALAADANLVKVTLFDRFDFWS
ncbi:MAG: FAD-dependent oxidoreductase [Parvularculaceae bacterium]